MFEKKMQNRDINGYRYVIFIMFMQNMQHVKNNVYVFSQIIQITRHMRQGQ